MSGQINAFEMAQKQFDGVAKELKLDPGVAEVLRWPMREYSFRIPVRMDDGSLKVFQGFRVQHNDARAPDVGTTPQMMGWMMDEYSRLVGSYTPGVFTGKPLGGGGSLGRTEATGYGVIYTVREAMKHLKIDSKNAVAAIEGFGNVAQYAAIGFIEMLGGTVACVSCWDRHEKKAFTYSHPDCVDPRFLLSIVDEYGTINKSEIGRHTSELQS